MRIVIIEDEKITADDLAQTIMQLYPQARIVHILSTVKESIDYFREGADIDLKPDFRNSVVQASVFYIF